MARDYPIRNEPTFDEPRSAASVLDRELTFALPSRRWLVLAVTLISATLLRLPGLNRWPLTAEEGATALAGWNLVQGNDIPADLLGRPLLVEWVALFTFLGHASDSVVRMSAALAGVAVVGLILAMGRWVGSTPALATALLVALSPTMIANSRRIDGGMLVTLLVLVFISTVVAGRRSLSPLWPAATGVTAALLFLAGPVGVVGLILAGLAAALFPATGTAAGRASALVPAAVGFVISYVLVATVVFTRPGSLWSATAEIFDQLVSVQLASAGSHILAPVANLLANEPLLVALAIIGYVATDQRDLARVTAIWTLTALVIVSLMGEAGIAGHALVVLPLAILGGLGAAHMVQRIPWSLVRSGPAALFVGALLLLFLATLSLIGLISPPGGVSGWDWIARLVLIVLIVVLPLAVFISLVSSRISGHHLVLGLSAFVVLLSVLTIRAAVLSASERPGTTTDPLADDALAGSIPQIIDRTQRLSVDLTRTQRTIQDPTGGHGLHIAIDRDIEHPLAWYFRSYPNLTVFDPATETPAEQTQVAFLAGHRDPELDLPGMRTETYTYRYEAPDVFSDPDWGNLLSSLFSISDLRHFGSYLVERTDPAPEDRIDFHYGVTPAIAERLYGPTGPFALADMAGAGTEGGQFSSPRGIATSEDGRTYVVDSGNQRIQVFDPDGNFLFSFGEGGEAPGQLGQFSSGQGGAGGIAIAGDRVFVADTWNHRIQVFDLDGAFLYGWGSFYDALDDPDMTTTNAGQFYGPRGIAVSDDMVFVTDTGNERVQVFDLDGNAIAMWGSTGNEDDQLLEPVGIAVADGTVFVADSHNSRVSRFTVEGDPLGSWRVVQWEGLRFFEPYLAVSNDGRLLASTSATNDLLAIDIETGEVEEIPPGEILRPYGIAIQPQGDAALVTDGVRNAVVPLPLNSE